MVWQSTQGVIHGGMQVDVAGIPTFRKDLDSLTRGDRSGMRKSIRNANQEAARLITAKAKELVPYSDKPRGYHLRGAIRNMSTSQTTRIVAGNKNVWWGWMRHAGRNETETKFKGGRRGRTPMGYPARKNIDYPLGQPYLRAAVKVSWPEYVRLHTAEMDKVVDSWNGRQRRAFAARGRI